MMVAVKEEGRTMAASTNKSLGERRACRQRIPGTVWIAMLGLLFLTQPGPVGSQTAQEIEEVFWQSVVCERAGEVELYLETYPQGRYVAEAWACLEQQLGLDRAARVLVQQGLTALEYEVGAADGLFGPATRAALRAWQTGKGFAATGYLTRAQAETLMAQGREAVAAQRQREAARQQAEAERERREAERRRAQEAERRRAQEAERQAQEREAERQRQEAVRKQRQPDETFRDCPSCPELVVVPAGSYQMGSPSHEEGRDDNEGPVHRVTIGQPFAVGVYEVTFGEWEACVRGGGCNGYRPDDEGWGRGQRPVIHVNWQDAQAYVAWLSRQTGQAYRLLSEAEWEYVARAGTTTPFHFGRTISTSQANYDGNYTYGGGRRGQYRGRTVPVGSSRPNAFGLYDVHGNVWEWVQDCWNANYVGAPSDGRAWETGDCSRRVLRGGSWGNFPWNLRSAIRLGITADDRFNSLGFRIARSLP